MRKLIFIVLILGICASSCSPTTQIVNSWRDPDATVHIADIHKFVVAALLKNESTKRSTEDDMAKLFPGKAVQSYKVFGSGELREGEDFYKQKLIDGGYDGIVIMRLVKVEKDQYYVPGSYPAYYGGWWGYYHYAYPGFYDPGYLATDKTFYVETNVYSTKRDKLIWTAITSSVDPSGREDLFDKVAKKVADKMKSEGFLK